MEVKSQFSQKVKKFITGEKNLSAQESKSKENLQAKLGTSKHVNVNRTELKKNLVEIAEKEAALLL